MAESPQSTTHSSATDSTSKCRKLSNDEAKFNTTIDSISALPDSVLSHILSFLPTRQAVATSVLSTRWKNLWTLVPTLDFVDNGFLITERRVGDQVGSMNFVQFVYRVLVLRHNALSIKKFALRCYNQCDPFHFNAWICAAIAHGVEELDLCLFLGQPVELPRRLFTCETLVVLKLNDEIVLNVPSSVYFPSLKILHLHHLDCEHSDSVQKLIAGCPILEDLLMIGLCFDNEGTFHINAPSLKNLNLDYVIARPEFTFSIENLSSVVEANVSVGGSDEHDEQYGNCAFQLLRGLYNVKFLSLSGNTMKSLKYASSYDMPMFHNLTSLEIVGDCWHLVPNFLESSHNLEVLSLQKYGHACWRQPQRVPKCFSSRLTKIEIKKFLGWKDELKLVRYILKNAKVLKTLRIDSSLLNLKGKLRVLKKLSMIARGSDKCQLAFI